MAKIAAIDLGTNTFLCLIAEVQGQVLKSIEDVARVVRLGEKVSQTKRFSPEALKRAKACLEDFSRLIEKHKVDHVVATATSAARDATNGGELLDIGLTLNIPISIIEGEMEARLSFDGAISAVQGAAKKNILVIDVGGGSTELIFRRAGETKIRGISFDVGCVRLTEMFLKKDPLDKTEYEKMFAYGASAMKDYGRVDPDLVIAVAGTPTTLAAIAQEIDFDERKVEGFVLSREKITSLVFKLGGMPLEQRKKVRGIEPLRADVIVAGGALLLCALDVAQRNEMVVSTRGLRYGAALHYKELI